MKKIRIGIITAVFLVALTIGGQAALAKPYKHLTMGDVMATFEAGWTGGSVVFYQNELTHPAVASVFDYDGPYPGRILPWGYGMEFDVDDAHRISIGVSFNEGYDIAKFYQ
ncbi:MAG: hypothetical protein KAS47_08725, partial [Candidatus Heimdallarchaeota archaeon]|nr:hypothetical protein [Candidatus Heimdallarchaeota archaeon]